MSGARPERKLALKLMNDSLSSGFFPYLGLAIILPLFLHAGITKTNRVPEGARNRWQAHYDSSFTMPQLNALFSRQQPVD